MVSTFSPNIQLEEPARGDQVGVWDTPVNANMTLLDSVTGNITTISLNNANVTLATAQFQSKTITFNSTLTGSVTITFPTSFKKSYEIYHTCTGSSAFTITLATTAAGGQVVCCLPGEAMDVFNDGTNIKYKSLGHRIGEYWDYAGSSLPNWVSGCSVAPYVIANGGTINSSTYPVLAAILNGTTLPDQRGRTRYMLDQGVGRVTVGQSGVNGNTIFAGGGDQLSQSHSHGITDPGHTHVQHPNTIYLTGGAVVSGGTGTGINPVAGTVTNASVTGISVNSNLSGGSQNMPPLLVSGLTLIRAG